MMRGFFQRQIADYAAYHRDGWNGLTHIVGNPIIFLAVILPFSLLPMTIFGVQTNAGVVLLIPALVLWMTFDFTIGLAIVVSAIPLLWLSAFIVSHVSVAWVWTVAGILFVVGWALQVIGHRLFERNNPALLDNPIHMLMSPMYIFAKLYIAFGLRSDLAALLKKPAGQMSLGSPLYRGDDPADLGQTP
jgi:uncharacterized membrane protein YGL010W